MSKYYNSAIIGNSKILGCLNDCGEIIRLNYPYIDYFQNVDSFKMGFAKDGKVRWFSDACEKKQYYKGNIVYTELNLDGYEILQRDYVLLKRNVIVRKIQFNKKGNLFVYSKLNSDVNKKVSSMVVDNTLIQYCQEMYMATFSSNKIDRYQINNIKNALLNGELNPEDYIGMSEDAAFVYKDVSDITIYIALDNNLKDCLKTVEWCKKQEENLLYESTKKYWDNYLEKFRDNIVYQNINKIKEKEIIDRTILMFALVSNPETGATLASPDVDENFEFCGRYGYCWPRDALFINKSLNILGLKKHTEKFYSVWAPKAQLKSGLFEQRYYSSGELAPSWGVQIDETAAVVLGVYENGTYKEHAELIIKAITGLINFIGDDYLSKECYDLWEERKGKHLYSTASIYSALEKGKIMLEKIDKVKNKQTISVIENTLYRMKDSMLQNFVEGNYLKRSTDNNQTDISLLSLVVPFNILNYGDLLVTNTLKKFETDLKMPNGGYMRYQWDSYKGGNTWIISSLWMALYYLEAKDFNKAKEIFDWVTVHADSMGFLPEQIARDGHHSEWVTQLSWSHAMYIIVRAKLASL